MKKAFTLVELAIVLVILGLLTAGVVGGQSLLESSKASAQIAQFRELSTAANAFKLEYDCVPGDCKDTSLYFTGASSGFCGYDNGNGDKVIQSGGTGAYDTNPYQGLFVGEGTYFLNSLIDAGIYQKTQKYICGANAVAGVNVPESPFKGTGIFVTSINYKNGFYWGMSRPYTPCCGGGNGHFASYTDESINEGTATPKVAFSIDKKIDDGLPYQGRVYAAFRSGGDGRLHMNNHPSGTCGQGATNVYNLSLTSKTCKLFVEGGF